MLGYPLRIVVGKMASFMLWRTVYPVGTALTNGVQTVFIDAPCSGIKMLTVSVALAAAVSLFLQLGPLRTGAVLGLGLFLALAGNALRAASLFVVANSGRAEPADVETMVGLTVFGGCAAALVWGATRLRPDVERGGRFGGVQGRSVLAVRVLAVACAAAAVAPLSAASLGPEGPGGVVEEGAELEEVDWPESWEGQALRRVNSEEGTSRFYGEFEGHMAEFLVGEGGRRVLMRVCDPALERFHPADVCYRANGWQVTGRAAHTDGQGHTWDAFEVVSPEGERQAVRQCFFEFDPGKQGGSVEELLEGAASWQDVSSCYWAVARPRAGIAFVLALTVVE